jgi:hypothetical protein
MSMSIYVTVCVAVLEVSLVPHSSFMTPLLYYAVPTTSDFPHILFIATYNIRSVQSLNISAHAHYSIHRHNLLR